MDANAMDQISHEELSPYQIFSRRQWSKLRADTPLTLSEVELNELQGLNERVSMSEVVDIYLPLSRLLNLYVAATQELYKATHQFLGGRQNKVPLHHRDGRKRGRRQEHHGAYSKGIAVALAEPSEGRSGSNRWVPAAQCGA